MLSKKEFIEILKKIRSIDILDPKEKRYLNNILSSENDLPDSISLAKIVEKLALKDLREVTDEDGYFKQITENSNSEKSIIYYVLNEEQISCLHTLQVDEKWEWLGGSTIAIYIFLESEYKEIILGPDNPTFMVNKDTLFGARNILSSNDSPYSLVTCTCEPSFHHTLYSIPTSDELKKLQGKHGSIIDELTPKILKNPINKTKSSDEDIHNNPKNKFIRSAFLFCAQCIGIKKNEEQTPLINSPQNNR